MRTWHVLAAMVALLAGCQAAVEPRDGDALYIRGTAQVVSVDPTLGSVVLDYQHRRVEAFWQTELRHAQGGSVAPPDSPLKAPIGVYRESSLRAQDFPGKPGDTIEFTGMRMGGSIFLQGVTVVSH